MRKILIFSICFINLLKLSAQSLEEKMAIKVCDCLETKSIIDYEFYKECISKSIMETVLSGKDSANIEVINTVEGLQGLMKSVDSIAHNNCNKINEKKLEEKKQVYYSKSKNEVANSYYQTSFDMMNDNNYKLAMEGLQIATKLDDKFVNAYDHLGVCYRHLKEYDKSIEYYKKSLELFPEGDLALMNIGLVYALKSEYKTSNEYYERLIFYYPNNAEGYFGAGKNYVILNDYEKALNDIFTAHLIYMNEKSEYVSDTEQVIRIIHNKMKKENKEDLFHKISEKYKITIE